MGSSLVWDREGLEAADYPICRAIEVSGRTLKHVAAGVSMRGMIKMLKIVVTRF